MARHDEQTNVRLPLELKEWLRDRAAESRRSVTAELIVILEQSRKTQEAAYAQPAI